MATKEVTAAPLFLDFMNFHMRLRVSGMGPGAQGLRRTEQELLIVRFLFRIPHSSFPPGRRPRPYGPEAEFVSLCLP